MKHLVTSSDIQETLLQAVEEQDAIALISAEKVLLDAIFGCDVRKMVCNTTVSQMVALVEEGTRLGMEDDTTLDWHIAMTKVEDKLQGMFLFLQVIYDTYPDLVVNTYMQITSPSQRLEIMTLVGTQLLADLSSLYLNMDRYNIEEHKWTGMLADALKEAERNG